jgi:MFS family permease
MAAAAEDAGQRTAGIGAAVVPLLALAIFINYVDRGNLATAAPLMKDELKLSGGQIGLLLSAFFWVYTPAMPFSGWLAEKINPYRTLAIGLVIWSVATVVSGFVTGFVALVILRALLGLGESAALPCSSKLLAQHLPSHRLGSANGLIGVGLALGPGFGTYAGGMLMAHVGWRLVFIIFGLASALWLIPWLLATRHVFVARDDSHAGPQVSFADILRTRDIWGCVVGHFSANYAFYFLISWLPLYLVKSRHFSVSQMALVGGLIYVVYAVSNLVSGWISDRWMQAGASANRVRKTMSVASHLIVTVSLFACALGDAHVAIVGLFCAGIGFGPNTSTIFAIGQTLAGPRATGKWIGVQNGLGNIAGIIAPIITGAVIDRTGQFMWAFVIAGAAALLGAVGWGLMVEKVAPIDWARRA